MAKYHVNPATGNTSRCRADTGNCPFGGEEDHYSTPEAAREAYEQTQESFRRDPQTLSSVAQQALSSNLEWQGKIPGWLAKPSREQLKTFGTKPKILDVIDSPLGKLAVIWEKNSMASNDVGIEVERGYEINRITFNGLESGQEVAYLKMASINDESMRRSFGDDEWKAFAWADDTLGSRVLRSYEKDTKSGKIVSSLKIRETSGEDYRQAKRQVWADAHKALGIAPKDFDTSQLTWGSLVNLTAEHAPSDEATLDRDLEVLRKEYTKKMDAHVDWHRDPTIDYIRVSDELRGKGIGHALYIYGARMQAEHGQVLRASGIQTEEAQNSWRRMKKLGLPVKTMKKPRNSSPDEDETNEYLYLDFRDNG